MKQNDCEDLESRIVAVAKQLFIEKGFEETSMSEIAQRVGINRPGLHYYFRTKDKMFQRVFGDIVLTFLPGIKDIVTRQDRPFGERVSDVIDAYYESVFIQNPSLPLFMAKEINRDAHHLVSTVCGLNLDSYVRAIAASLQEEMAAGKINAVPLRTVFLTFYSLLITPCLAKDMISITFLRQEETFADLLSNWKPNIIRQMSALLGFELPAGL